MSRSLLPTFIVLTFLLTCTASNEPDQNQKRDKRTVDVVLKSVADVFGYDVVRRISAVPANLIAPQKPTFFPPPLAPLPPGTYSRIIFTLGQQNAAQQNNVIGDGILTIPVPQLQPQPQTPLPPPAPPTPPAIPPMQMLPLVPQIAPQPNPGAGQQPQQVPPAPSSPPGLPDVTPAPLPTPSVMITSGVPQMPPISAQPAPSTSAPAAQASAAPATQAPAAQAPAAQAGNQASVPSGAQVPSAPPPPAAIPQSGNQQPQQGADPQQGSIPQQQPQPQGLIRWNLFGIPARLGENVRRRLTFNLNWDKSVQPVAIQQPDNLQIPLPQIVPQQQQPPQEQPVPQQPAQSPPQQQSPPPPPPPQQSQPAPPPPPPQPPQPAQPPPQQQSQPAPPLPPQQPQPQPAQPPAQQPAQPPSQQQPPSLPPPPDMAPPPQPDQAPAPPNQTPMQAPADQAQPPANQQTATSPKSGANANYNQNTNYNSQFNKHYNLPQYLESGALQPQQRVDDQEAFKKAVSDFWESSPWNANKLAVEPDTKAEEPEEEEPKQAKFEEYDLEPNVEEIAPKSDNYRVRIPLKGEEEDAGEVVNFEKEEYTNEELHNPREARKIWGNGNGNGRNGAGQKYRKRNKFAKPKEEPQGVEVSGSADVPRRFYVGYRGDKSSPWGESSGSESAGKISYGRYKKRYNHKRNTRQAPGDDFKYHPESYDADFSHVFPDERVDFETPESTQLNYDVKIPKNARSYLKESGKKLRLVANNRYDRDF